MSDTWLCKDCLVEKPYNTEHFYADRHRPSGYSVYCKDCINKRGKAYTQTETGRLNLIRKSKRMREKHRMKWDARQALRYAVKVGKIDKPNTCSDCGRAEKVEGHHNDYSKPLEVIWLCYLCHAALHRKLRNLPAGKDIHRTVLYDKIWYLPTSLVSKDGRVTLIVHRYQLRRGSINVNISNKLDALEFANATEMADTIRRKRFRRLPAEADGNPQYVPIRIKNLRKKHQEQAALQNKTNDGGSYGASE